MTAIDIEQKRETLLDLLELVKNEISVGTSDGGMDSANFPIARVAVSRSSRSED